MKYTYNTAFLFENYPNIEKCLKEHNKLYANVYQLECLVLEEKATKEELNKSFSKIDDFENEIYSKEIYDEFKNKNIIIQDKISKKKINFDDMFSIDFDKLNISQKKYLLELVKIDGLYRLPSNFYKKPPKKSKKYYTYLSICVFSVILFVTGLLFIIISKKESIKCFGLFGICVSIFFLYISMVNLLTLKNQILINDINKYNNKNKDNIKSNKSNGFSLNFGKLGKFDNVEFSDFETDNDLSEEQKFELKTNTLTDWQNKLSQMGEDYYLDFALTMMLFESSISDIDFWENYRKLNKEFSNVDCKESFDNLCAEMNFDDAQYKFSNEKIHFEAEKFIRENMPYVDIDKLINSINIECVYIEKNNISIQFSEKSNNIFLSAYFQIYDNLTFDDWHNF